MTLRCSSHAPIFSLPFLNLLQESNGITIQFAFCVHSLNLDFGQINLQIWHFFLQVFAKPQIEPSLSSSSSLIAISSPDSCQISSSGEKGLITAANNIRNKWDLPYLSAKCLPRSARSKVKAFAKLTTKSKFRCKRPICQQSRGENVARIWPFFGLILVACFSIL